jgi:exonuclease VII large subunit
MKNYAGDSWDITTDFGTASGFEAGIHLTGAQSRQLQQQQQQQQLQQQQQQQQEQLPPQQIQQVNSVQPAMDERAKMVAMYWRRLAGLRPHRSFATRYIQTLDKFM